MSHFSFLILLFISLPVFAQKKWDGGGGTNAWNNGNNWTGNTVPSASDNVVLDNSVVTTGYSVLLPTTAVTVNSITITPTINRTIDLTLPNANTLAPALTVSGSGYGMILNAGAVFRNSSGSSSGTAVNIVDSIKISNGGKYIHNSAGAHALNVHRLSVAPNTENGIFEFDIPTASSTISLSGRIFGRLVFKSQAAGGTCNYTAAGTSRVVVRGNMDIGTGVSLNLNFSDTIFINGNLSQEGGTFNLGNAPRSVVVVVGQNIFQAAGAVITETGSGIQTIVMGSSRLQQLEMHGTWLNQVAFVKTGQGALSLKSDLNLPYKLILKAGRIVSTEADLLTLQSACTIEADSLAEDTYIEGPLKKDGLNNSSFLFPVGADGKLRWLKLEQATGTYFIIYYFKNDPNTLSTGLGTGLHHLSSVEYWNVVSAANSTAKVKLSFDDPHSGGVTNLDALRVARLEFANWQNAGNTGHSGSPGSNGWVSSIAASGFSANTKSFALASAISQENPLPIYNTLFKGTEKDGKVYFTWKLIGDDDNVDVFEIEESMDGQNFSIAETVKAENKDQSYSHVTVPGKIAEYFRLIIKNRDGNILWQSSPIHVKRTGKNKLILPAGNLVRSQLLLDVTVRKPATVRICVFNSAGIAEITREMKLQQGYSRFSIDLTKLNAGVYYLRDVTGNVDGPSIRVIKLSRL